MRTETVADACEGSCAQLCMATRSWPQVCFGFECRAHTEAVLEPLVASVQLDVSLRPDDLLISGADRPVEAGSLVSLVCTATAARPAAVLTWYNGSALFPDQPAGQVTLGDDGTYQTSSRLSFLASRFEDNEKIYCEANNEVLQYYKEPAMRTDVMMEVRYPPVVTISPATVTVNMSQEVTIRCSYEANPSRLVRVIQELDDLQTMPAPEPATTMAMHEYRADGR